MSKINDNSIIRYVEFNDVDFVISVLLGLTPVTAGNKIYRGQGVHAQWKVLPSVLRDNEMINNDEFTKTFSQMFFGLDYEKVFDSEYLLRMVEMNQIQVTYNTASSKGLEAPTSLYLDNYLHKSLFSNPVNSIELIENCWPLSETVQFMSFYNIRV